MPDTAVTRSYSETLAAAGRAPGLRKGERTRLRLLAATADLLQTTFFHALRVTDICRAARVSQGTFYLYFSDRGDIVTRLLTDFAATVFDTLDAASDRDDAYGAVHAPTLAYVHIFRANRGLLRCLTQLTEESTAFEQIYRELNADWNRRSARAIAAALGGGTRDSADSLAAAYALSSMVDEFLTTVYVRQDPELAVLADDPERVAAILSRLWYRAVHLAEPETPDVQVMEKKATFTDR
jgi:AcrR family transcriptional regulator